jgi:hypothetical protein
MHAPDTPMRQNATSCDNSVTQYALRNTQSPRGCLACAVAAVPLG